MLRRTWRRLCCADPPAELSLLNLPVSSADRPTTQAGSSTATRAAGAAGRRPLECRRSSGRLDGAIVTEAIVKDEDPSGTKPATRLAEPGRRGHAYCRHAIATEVRREFVRSGVVAFLLAGSDLLANGRPAGLRDFRSQYLTPG